MAKRLFKSVFGIGLLIIACFFSFMFVGCSSSTKFSENPLSDDVVVGNGSLAVTKGDYLYFVNGYTPYADVGSTNKEGKITYAGLYRIKLDENGNPEKVEAKLDNNGNEIFDGSRSLKNIDILASKVVGFEYMGIYIFGDYIYYASPNNEVDKNLTPTTQYIDFFRRKLDRSGAAEKIYTTKSEGSKVKYSMISVDGDVFLNVLDGNNLVVIKNKKTKVTVESVSDVIFAPSTRSDEQVPQLYYDIYYTRNLSEEDTQTNGNVLCKFDLKTMTYGDVFKDNDSTITLKMISNNNLFYEKTKQSDGTQKAKLYYASGVQSNNFVGETEVCSQSYSNYYAKPSSNSVFVNDGSSILYIGNGTTKTIYSGSVTVIKAVGDYIYLATDSNSILRVNFQEIINGNSVEPETVVSEKVKTGQDNFYLVTNNKLYYLSTNQTNDSVYLHMVDLNDNLTDYFVGVLNESDYDTQESETEDDEI